MIKLSHTLIVLVLSSVPVIAEHPALGDLSANDTLISCGGNALSVGDAGGWVLASPEQFALRIKADPAELAKVNDRVFQMRVGSWLFGQLVDRALAARGEELSLTPEEDERANAMANALFVRQATNAKVYQAMLSVLEKGEAEKVVYETRLKGDLSREQWLGYLIANFAPSGRNRSRAAVQMTPQELMAMLKQDRLAKKKVIRLRQRVDQEIRKESPALGAFLDHIKGDVKSPMAAKDQALLVELNAKRWQKLTGDRAAVVEMSPPLARFIDLSELHGMLWESDWMSDLDRRLPAGSAESVSTPRGVQRWIDSE